MIEDSEYRVVYSGMRTPDGTLLESLHRHDYQCYVDKNGESYILGGGCEDIRSSINKVPAKMITLKLSDGIEVIREYWTWGTFGKSGLEPLRRVKLKDMSNLHLEAINEGTHPHAIISREISYRDQQGICITE